jgi:hypothetical protein
MAWRLGDLVVCGEIINRRNYSTHGWIQLRGHETPLLLQLTGNCDPDLYGRHVRFEVPEERRATHEEPTTDLKKLAWQQVGPTISMTAERKVRALDCPVDEYLERRERGEDPPTEWKRCLYLEWNSQNGRMVVELIDPVLEFVEWDGTTREGEPLALPDEEQIDGGGLQITEFEIGEDGQATIRDLSSGSEDDEEEDATDDPYDLFPDDLQQQFDAETSETDRSLDDDDEGVSQTIREMELMDDLIEGGEGEPIGTLFDSPVKLPRPDQLTDEEIEPALKTLLTHLAMCGIALDVCEHYTPRDAYRLLIEEICVEERAYPQLRGTQWVQHFMTSEHCPACDEQAERDFQEYERKRKLREGGDDRTEPPPDDAAGDEEMPF